MPGQPKPPDAYAQAVESGRYARTSGLQGKYDNVRLYWEDNITQVNLRPFVDALVGDRVAALRRVRILDLGCGSGDGYETFMRMPRRDPGIYDDEVRIIRPDYLGFYKGVDNNEALLGQTQQRWKGRAKMAFSVGDFSRGLPVEEGEDPYDIYFSSFGALSHLNEEQTVTLFSEIARHAQDGALIVGDWLGRYSYEWQDLWEADTSREQWMEYAISYIYPDRARRPRKLELLNLRLLGRDEILRIVSKVEERTGLRLEVQRIFDRSLFVGRHMDTGDYNAHLKPVRRYVNSLHEDNHRTALDHLLVDYRPRPGFALLNRFFEQLQTSWNTLVRYSIDLCQRYDESSGTIPGLVEIPGYYPEGLKRAMNDIRRVVEGSAWLRIGDPRANVIEPQLGYALRGLEMELQQGAGNGHGLVGIFTVRKG